MSRETLLTAMERRNRLIEGACQEIGKKRAEQLKAFAKGLTNEFEVKRADALSAIGKLEEEGKYGF